MRSLDKELVSATIVKARRRWSVFKIAVMLGVTPATVYNWERKSRCVGAKHRKALVSLSEKIGDDLLVTRWRGDGVYGGGLDPDLVRETLRRARRRGATGLDLILHFRRSQATVRRWELEGNAPEPVRDAFVSLCEKYGMKGLKDEWTS